ncbi:DUF3667 domain-containing protein [Sphingosinicella terrae]|uniref:DUF3667 domain-containing protein n=1 Tax=Sphingosinicella terrae TaxID=2172047 RepID=UPI000E0D8F79|nr:DUF3667 domain-containing protein [Sphingosinicella terrae]
MAGIEGIGEAIEGSMVARAVEPAAGEAAHASRGNCLNCGAELVGSYCHRCGQSGHVHRTLGAFWHDLLHSVLHFEGKVWRTLPLLAWRPGELTRRYIDGERARFVSPVALFLFSVFTMFAVFSLVGGPFSSSQEAQAGAREQAARDLGEEQAELREDLAELRAERQRLVRAGQATVAVDRNLASVEQDLAATERAMSATRILTGADIADARESGLLETASPTGLGWIDDSIRKAQENPALVAYKLQTNAYKFSWALIPISVPFVWLLFLHRRRYRRFGAYDHIVFVTYSITFMSLGLIALSLLRPLNLGDLAELAMLIVPPLHIYRHLKGTYGLGRRSALWRTFLLILFAFIALSLFVSLLLSLGGAG